jgi:CRP-like cAMP-binding protein
VSVRRPHPEVLGLFKAFAELDEAELEALAGVLVIKQLSTGDTLFVEGQVADGCYLIADGRVRVTVQRQDGPEQLAMLGRGDLVGQMSLLDGGKRSATCTAVEDAVAFHMSRDEFDLVFRSGSSFALKFVDVLTRMLVSQLRYANRRLIAMTARHMNEDSRDPRVQGYLKDVALRTLVGNVDDVELDAVEVVVPDGLRKD